MARGQQANNLIPRPCAKPPLPPQPPLRSSRSDLQNAVVGFTGHVPRSPRVQPPVDSIARPQRSFPLESPRRRFQGPAPSDNAFAASLRADSPPMLSPVARSPPGPVKNYRHQFKARPFYGPGSDFNRLPSYTMQKNDLQAAAMTPRSQARA